MYSLLVFLLVAAGASAHSFAPQDEKESPLWVRSGKYQGDMVLLPEQEFGLRTGIINSIYRWPNGVLVYKLRDGDFTDAEAAFIRNALQWYNENTCVTVREATASDSHYILVTKENSGCWSYVGYVAWAGAAYSPQQLNLQHNSGGSCLWVYIILHEFLHAWGFYHSQSATNRDAYVTVHWENILEGTEHNFEKYDANTITDYGCPYDIESVMHYAKYDFSKNGEPTLTANSNPDLPLGNNEGLTQNDIDRLDCMYKNAGVAGCQCRCPYS